MKYTVRHFRVGSVMIDYAFNKQFCQYMYHVGSTGNAYKYEADAVAFARRVQK